MRTSSCSLRKVVSTVLGGICMGLMVYGGYAMVVTLFSQRQTTVIVVPVERASPPADAGRLLHEATENLNLAAPDAGQVLSLGPVPQPSARH